MCSIAPPMSASNFPQEESKDYGRNKQVANCKQEKQTKVKDEVLLHTC